MDVLTIIHISSFVQDSFSIVLKWMKLLLMTLSLGMQSFCFRP